MVNPTVNSRSASPAKTAESIAGRKHPVTAVTRLTHGTKGRAKDAARAQGMSLCAFIRAAVRDALDDALDHQESRHQESRHQESPGTA